jgi:hypothetical protein
MQVSWEYLASIVSVILANLLKSSGYGLRIQNWNALILKPTFTIKREKLF